MKLDGGGSHKSPYSRETVDLGRLRAILSNRRGEAAAIRARDLCALLGLGNRDRYPERSIREAINILIGQGMPIGSTVSEPAGYFLVQTEAELQKCAANYLARARQIQRKAEALVAASRRPGAQKADEQPPLLPGVLW